jgi:hypothetical protein
MRVSIWRQFSSNHSNSFVVVGKFATPEQAQQVAEQLRADIKTVNDFWNSLSEADYETWHALRATKPTPPEEALKAKYGLWATDGDGNPRGIEWLDFGIVENLANVVQVYRELVFIENAFETNDGQRPFDTILMRLGGQVAYWLEPGGEILKWSFEFDMPDEAEAQAFVQRVKDFFAGIKSFSIPPTDDYYVDVWDIQMQLHQQGNHVQMSDFHFSGGREHETFAAFIQFLEEHGAQNIQYTVKGEEVRFPPTSNP